MSIDLHIVTLNIPYPPDYGGMIDTYYRIRALHDLGVRVHLHCFEYGRRHPDELESICETTNYYPRETGLFSQFSSVPYIIKSRRSALLLKNLVKDDYPILFDGLHCTFYIDHPALSGRKKLVRLHNVEHKYYMTLAKNERELFKKSYYYIESFKLNKYEMILANAKSILPISSGDHEYFNNKYHNSVYLAPFHPFYKTESLTGTGEYVIYHGDLSVKENAVVADFLIGEVFSKVPYRCLIAGKDPPKVLRSKASGYTNIEVISDPGDEQMISLIANAQVNILPVLSNNGFKMKLLMALYAGRHCLVNNVAVKDTSLESLCHVADTGENIVKKIHLLMNEPFTDKMIIERKKILSEHFDIKCNAEKLIALISS